MPKLVFDSDLHAYYIEGKRVPSVTQILTWSGFYGDGPAHWLPWHAERGTRVHHACHEINKQLMASEKPTITLNPEAFPDPVMFAEVVTRVKSYLGWRKQTGFIPIACEERMYEEECNFCGTYDMIGRINNEPYLIDIKSGRPTKGDPLQLAAYGAMTDMRVTHLGCLYLSMGSPAELVEYDINNDDKEVFFAAARVVNRKIADGLIKFDEPENGGAMVEALIAEISIAPDLATIKKMTTREIIKNLPGDGGFRLKMARAARITQLDLAGTLGAPRIKSTKDDW